MEPILKDASEATPPASPSAVRRARDDDVFLRLTGAATDHAQGTVKEITAKRASVGGGGGGVGGAGAWLQCTHVAEGHVGAALSLAATADLLYSGGVDRTVRGWDVSAGREAWRAWGGAAVGALAAGAGAAHDSRLVLAAAGPAVKLFDTRTNGPQAVLWSSGASGVNAGVKGGETAITALALAPPHRLYTAAADKLRLWDLRMLECLYKTWSGHAAAVMCMAREALDSGDRLATGSRDHCVRVIDLHHDSGGCEVQGRRQLEPPHYDGVQALLLRGAALYSASRDSSLKCWSLDDNSLAHSVMNAHKGWVTGVVGVGGIVVSCGRDAALRAWTPALRPAAPPAPAPDPPAALAAAPSHAPPAVYTAGSNGRVRWWRVRAAR